MYMVMALVLTCNIIYEYILQWCCLPLDFETATQTCPPTSWEEIGSAHF